MLKKLLLTFLVMTAVGCSFSKKSSKDTSDNTQVAAQSRVDEVMADQRYGITEKIAAAISKKDKKLFLTALEKVSDTDLSKLIDGKSLGELAVDSDELFFLKELLDAGFSPYLATATSPYGLRWYASYLKAGPANDLIADAREKLLQKASMTCATADLDVLMALLDQKSMSPSQRVCGDKNLFSFYLLGRPYNDEVVDVILTKYLNHDRIDYSKNVQLVVYSSIVAESSDLLKKVLIIYQSGSLEIEGKVFESEINRLPLESALNAYLRVSSALPKGLLSHVQYYFKERIEVASEADKQKLSSLIQQTGLLNAEGAKPFPTWTCTNSHLDTKSAPAVVLDAAETPPPPGEGGSNEPTNTCAEQDRDDDLTQ